jgi:hypothetical protein
MPDVPDCPEPLALNAIRNAAIDFCTQTLWLQEDYGVVAVTAATLPFTLVPPAGLSVAQIMVGVMNGIPLVSTTIDELDSRVLGWRDARQQPRAYFQPAPGVIDFYPRPAGTDSHDVFLRVAYAPTRTSTSVTDRLYDDYVEDIAAGAIARLMAIPGRPWTNAEAGKYYDGIFKSAKVKGAIEAAKSYGRNSQQIQMRSF